MADKLVLIDGKYAAGEKSLLGGGAKLGECTYSGQITRGDDASLVVGVVADGGGNADNNLHIAELAVGTVLDNLSNSRGSDISQIIEYAIESANQRVFEDNETNDRNGWTTLTVGVIFKDRLFVGNVGNSRAYWVSASGQMVQLTRDHTFYNIYGGDPESEEAGLVVNAVGKKPNVEVDLGFYPEQSDDVEEAYKLGLVGLPMQKGDSLVLCTDGLIRKDTNGNRFTSDEEIIEAVRMEFLSNKAATKMVSRAEGRRVDDNVSAVTIQYMDPEIIVSMNKSTDRTRKTMVFRRAFIGVGVLGLLVLVGFLGIALSRGRLANQNKLDSPAVVITQNSDQAIENLGPTPTIRIGQAQIRNVIGEGANVTIGESISSDTTVVTGSSLVQIGIGEAGGGSELYLFENSEAQIIFQPKLAPILIRGTIYIQPGTSAGGEVQFSSFPDIKASVSGSKMIVAIFGNEIRIFCFDGNCRLTFGLEVKKIPVHNTLIFDTGTGTFGELEEMSYEEEWNWNVSCQYCLGDTVPSPTPTPTRSAQNLAASPTPAGIQDSTTSILSVVPRGPVVGEAIKVTIVVTGKGEAPSGEVAITGSDKDCIINLPKVANGDPQGSCEVQFNSPGTKTLTATYRGDTNFRTSFNTSSVTVDKSPVTVEIVSFTPDLAQPGDKVIVSVSVTSAFQGPAPTGKVSISGPDEDCEFNLSASSAGRGSCPVVFETKKSYSVNASYSGDSNYLNNTGKGSYTPGSAQPKIIIKSDEPDPSTVGESVKVSVEVSKNSGGKPAPSGSVSITGESTAGCKISLNQGGFPGYVSKGSCTLIFSSAGSKTITANYAGDTNFSSGSTSNGHTVNKADTSVSITAHNPSPSALGGTVAVSVSVTSKGGTPTGSVSITGADTPCPITLSGGTGSCNVTFSTAGSKTLTASYGGDINFNPNSTSTGHNVNKGTTTTTISTDPVASTYPKQVTIKVTVTGSTAIKPEGSVSISGGESCTSINLTNGSGNCTVTFSSAGSKSLGASYNGDSNYTGSAGSTSHVVAKASTTTTIASSPNPSYPGQDVTVSVSVTSGAGTPAGTVSISGAPGCGNITLNASGTASCTANFTSAGSSNLSASYTGNNNFATSSSPNITQIVAKFATTTSITSHNPNPSYPGEAITINVTVASSNGTPNGEVTIGGVTGCTTITLSSGSGTCTGSLAVTGNITADYAGTTKYASSSDSKLHTVAKFATTTSITSHNPNPSYPGEAITINVTVASSNGTPNGEVTIGGVTGCTTITLSSGSGTCTGSLAVTGNITADYAGTTKYASSSDSKLHTVAKFATTTSITSHNPNPSYPGEAITINVTVASSNGTPNGEVTIGGVTGCTTITLSSGSGTCTGSLAVTGNITADYAGTTKYASSSDSKLHTVAKFATTTSITSHNPNPSYPGEAITINVTVASSNGTPNGEVTIGGVTGCTTITLSSGSGTCTGSLAVTGNITADYAGTTKYASSSDSKLHTVTPSPSFGEESLLFLGWLGPVRTFFV